MGILLQLCTREETSLVSACCLWILRHLDDKQVELKALDYCNFEVILPFQLN